MQVIRPVLRRVSSATLRMKSKESAPVSPVYKEFQAMQKAVGMKIAGIEKRRLKENEMKGVAALANAEGWNKSLEYLQSCCDVPAIDLWGAFKDGRVIGSLGRHDFENQATSMFGLYLMDKPYRNQGIGLKLVTTVLSPVQANNFIFLSVDPAIYTNIPCNTSSYRILAVKGRKSNILLRPNRSLRVFPLNEVSPLHLEEYDAKIHPLKRTAFFNNIIIGNAVSGYVALDDCDEVIGYGILQRTAEGWRFSPIYAETDCVGKELFRTLLNEVPIGDEITMDIYEDNQATLKMSEDHNFSRIFTSTLMYTETLCEIPVKKVYSIASQKLSPF